MKLQVYEAAPPPPDGVPHPARVADAEELRGWLPVDVDVFGRRPFVRWVDMRGVRLEEPFFQQTVGRVVRERGARAEVVTDIEALLQFEKTAGGVVPSGFIFHASRCGSTLVSNACAAAGGARVFSEPQAVDKLLGHFLTLPAGGDFRARLWQVFLRAAVSALGQMRGGDERGPVIKLACCSTLQLGRVQRLWPGVPWVFVYRDPVEIMVSNLANVPDWMRVGEQPVHTAAVVGLAPAEVARLTPEEFCARALGKFYDAAAEHAGARALLVDYEQLTPETLARAARHFGAAPTPAEVDEITRVSGLYSKDPARRISFAGDADAKRARATPHVREMAERWARQPYERLRRKEQGAGC